MYLTLYIVLGKRSLFKKGEFFWLIFFYDSFNNQSKAYVFNSIHSLRQTQFI